MLPAVTACRGTRRPSTATQSLSLRCITCHAFHVMSVWLNKLDACLSVWHVCLGRAVLYSCCAETATLAVSLPRPCVDARLVKPPV